MIKKRIKVGFLSQWDIQDPNVMSGTVHRAMVALKNTDIEIVDLGSIENELSIMKIKNQLKPIKTLLASHLTAKTKNKYHGIKATLRSLIRKLFVFNDGHIMLTKAEKLSHIAQLKLNAEHPNLDVLFGICTSTIFYQIKTDIPIIYASDTTADAFNSSYPEYIIKSHKYHDACNLIEKTSLDKSTFFLPASTYAQTSAIEHYGLPEKKVKMIEFGANIIPTHEPVKKHPPEKENLILCLVAADPKRKQLELCIEVANYLTNAGWITTLHYIGPHHKSLNHTDLVHWHGRLKLSDKKDQTKHQNILESSHWMLLPSIAEAYGIAPCEAAHFSVPSIVSDVGGLPTVVQHQRTGVVMPLKATATDYADEIITISQDKSRYLEMSAAALERAENTLSWSVWAEKVKALMYQAIEEKETNECNEPTSPKPALQSQAL